MRKLLLCLIAVALLGACRQAPHYNRGLLSIDSRLESDSSNIFHALDSLRQSGLSYPADSALYNLLFIEALHQNGLSSLDSASLKFSEHYFDSVGDHGHWVAALLQEGIMHLRQGDFVPAITRMKQAEYYSDGLPKRDPLHYDIQFALGEANQEAKCNELALQHYLKSLSCADSVSQRSRYAQSLLSIAQVYGKLGETDSFIICITRSLPMLSEAQPKAEALTTLADYHFHKRQLAKARMYAGKAANTGLAYLAARTMGDIEAAAGRMDKAKDFYYLAVNANDADTRIYAYHKLIDYYQNKKDDKTLLFLSENLNREYRNYQHINSTKIAAIQADMDYEWQQEAERHDRMKLIVSLLVLTVVVVLSIVIQKRRNGQLKRHIEQLNQQYNDYLQRYTRLSNEIEQAHREKDMHSSLLEEKKKEVERLSEKLAQFQEDKSKPVAWVDDYGLFNADIVFHLHNCAARGKHPESEDWQRLNDLFNEKQPDFMTRVNQRTPLSQRELSVCQLIRLRFIPSEIAVLLSSTPQVITNMRSHLLKKIFGEQGGARLFDSRIREV